tara:strand:- start:202 stop:570 length:369 start_codon:yes stop_codon:yes gene_type:complete
MQNRLIKRNTERKKRAFRVRKRCQGIAQAPRLCVVKSNKHIEIQLIDDEKGLTVLGLSSRKAAAKPGATTRSKEAARALGTKLAEQALEKGVTKVRFDRGFRKYHGILQELATAAREAGLQF